MSQFDHPIGTSEGAAPLRELVSGLHFKVRHNIAVDDLDMSNLATAVIDYLNGLKPTGLSALYSATDGPSEWDLLATAPNTGGMLTDPVVKDMIRATLTWEASIAHASVALPHIEQNSDIVLARFREIRETSKTAQVAARRAATNLVAQR